LVQAVRTVDVLEKLDAQVLALARSSVARRANARTRLLRRRASNGSHWRDCLLFSVCQLAARTISDPAPGLTADQVLAAPMGHSYRWEALVVYQDETLEGSPLVWKWFPVEQLRPLYPDPNPRQELNY
jgi:hypothetical protein